MVRKINNTHRIDSIKEVENKTLLNIYYNLKPKFTIGYEGTIEVDRGIIWLEVDGLECLITIICTSDPFVDVGLLCTKLQKGIITDPTWKYQEHKIDEQWKGFIGQTITRVEVIQATTISEHYEVKHPGAIRLSFGNNMKVLFLDFGAYEEDGKIMQTTEDELTIAFDESFLTPRLWDFILCRRNYDFY